MLIGNVVVGVGVSVVVAVVVSLFALCFLVPKLCIFNGLDGWVSTRALWESDSLKWPERDGKTEQERKRECALADIDTLLD